MQFDARAAKLLEPGQHITIDGYPGLRLTATQSTRTWVYRYKSPVDAKMRQAKIGRWPTMSLPAAIVAWEALREKREAGADVASDARAARAVVAQEKAASRRVVAGEVRTVRQVCDYYLAGHINKHRAEKGQKEIARMFSKMLGTIENEVASEMTRSQAFDLVQLYSHIPVQAVILRRELGSAWEFCLDAGKLPENAPNWWRLILRGKLKSKGKTINGERRGVVKRSLSPDEVGPLIRWLPNFTSPIADILTIYLWTATRGSEICCMRGSEVSEESTGLWWTIPKENTKNSHREGAADHRVPLFGRAATIVRRRKEAHGDEWLFPSYGVSGHWEQKSVQTRVYYQQPYCQTTPEHKRLRLPITHWAPHDLRRTSRTLLASLGCPSDVGEVILGHMLEGVEGVYNRHTYDKERRLWLEKLSDHLEKLATSPK